MERKTIFRLHNKAELITGKWWFTVIMLVLLFIPPYTTKSYNPEQTGDLVISVLSNALIYTKPELFPVFKIIPLIIFFLLFKFKNKAGRIFNAYAAFNFLLVAIFQNMANTDDYGFAVLTGNVVAFLIIALAWLWEKIVGKNDFDEINFNGFKYIIIVLAFIAYWYPINTQTLKPDFSLLNFLTSESGLTFCMLVPMYLALLILIYPEVNYVTLRITSLVGFIIGILNVIQQFVMNSFWWMGILHLPLLIISFYGLLLARRKKAKYLRLN